MVPFYPDTIDLQDHEAPSAKDHLRAAASDPSSHGSLAPHQAETLREVAAETAEENERTPRVSWPSRDVGDLHQYADDLAAGINGQRTATGNDMQASQQRDALAIAQNGGLEADDGDLESSDVDDSMDDDMMDKISSSPSIEDGGFPSTFEPVWPRRHDSLHRPFSASSSSTNSDARSSSPYLDHPDFMPLRMSPQLGGSPFIESPCRHHHLVPGGYNLQDRPISDDESNPSPGSSPSKGSISGDQEVRGSILDEVMAELHKMEQEALGHGLGVIEEEKEERKEEETAVEGLQLPDRPVQEKEVILDVDIDAIADTEFDAAYDDLIPLYDDVDDLTIPYEASDEDDDGDSENEDPNYIDYGFGVECLQDDTEDIDFEFVYALHTFVATVEGQANATKGDTMVLLDDSNSYWWLVRVVKDSSIGEFDCAGATAPLFVVNEMIF